MEIWNSIAEIVVNQTGYLSVMYFAVVLLVALDLWSGVKKAKQRGEATMSQGYKRTIDKLAKYFNTLLVLGIVDIVILISPLYPLSKVFPSFPYFSLIGVLFVAFIEMKSIREKAEGKRSYKSASILVGKIIESKDDVQKIIEEVINYMNMTDKKYLEKYEKVKGDEEDKECCSGKCKGVQS